MAKKHKQGKLLEHNYDGIQELDNDLPAWWLYLFYLTILIGVIYIIVYHVTGIGPDQAQEYKNEMNYWAKQKAAVEATKPATENLQTLSPLTNEASIANGQKIFTTNCSPCHAMDGGGGIGPNMTDNYWIHGNQFQQILKVITDGVPAKGMIPWKGVLKPLQIQEVGSYILTLKGKKTAKPKAPQGELYQ